MKHGGGGGGGEEVVRNSSSELGSNEQFEQPDTKSKCKLTFPEFENKEGKKESREE